MPESAADAESVINPYISPEEDKDNANRLRSDVADQLYRDILQKAERDGLKINPDDSPEEVARKSRALKELFDERSQDDFPDYQAAQIVDLEEKATRDPLTGLLNRRGFKKEFVGLLQDSNESGQPMLLLMIDLDYFKKINDVYGHSVGDQTLKYLARALVSSVDIGDTIARWGGDEFVIAIKTKIGQPVDPDKLLMVAERIRAAAIGLLSEDQYQLKPGAPEEKLPEEEKIALSVGATLTRAGDTLETVCQRADKNLYQAKNSGRNQSFGDDGQITPTLSPGVPQQTAST